ncbi:hypothetical protein D0861_05168 [Hortaea werneckii]|uniref:START domain-containing protein n=1 Tax=Hortaea werneckii TaxID=91943 RepID=A0A3M7FHR8_HORWE|nr:hypothetical protein D0861_05168 [Hortaea werneckii]
MTKQQVKAEDMDGSNYVKLFRFVRDLGDALFSGTQAQTHPISPTSKIMAEATNAAIRWPEEYLPGTSDNFTSNETIIKDLSVSQIWAKLADCTQWETYYGHNVEQVTPPPSGNFLKQGDTFRFSTFGFPVLDCKVEESIEPGPVGRLAWSAGLDGNAETAVKVYHAWLIEELPGGRVRILTQESQVGKPAAQLADAKPNRMLLGHQDWIEGLVAAARGENVDRRETNLGSVNMEGVKR